MINKIHILIALTASAFVGFANADVLYSSEDFEGGTVSYSINGVNNGTTSDSWFLLTASTVDALAGTDYDPEATSRVGIVANGDPTDITPGGVVPSGQHALVSTSQNRRLRSNYAMTLASDGATSLDISFSYMFYALGNYDALGSAVILYSASGDFTDEVQLASFGFGQVGSVVETPDYPTAAEEVWYTLNLSFTEAGAGITFTDTAAIRINRAPLIGGLFPEGDATTNHIVFLDDITVTGVVSAPTAPFVVTIAPAVDPNTGHDLQWNSQAGMTYSVLTSTDLSSPVETWTVLAADLAADPPQNSFNVPADGERRFYLIEETPAAP